MITTIQAFKDRMCPPFEAVPPVEFGEDSTVEWVVEDARGAIVASRLQKGCALAIKVALNQMMLDLEEAAEVEKMQAAAHEAMEQAEALTDEERKAIEQEFTTGRPGEDEEYQ